MAWGRSNHISSYFQLMPWGSGRSVASADDKDGMGGPSDTAAVTYCTPLPQEPDLFLMHADGRHQAPLEL